ncbi:hypothetical protein [Deinococcus sp.]|uniref:hypothetical protein n=1 Tax=Deinococcus sp. TaxID=47478 RepID=UPI002869D635|nr:hypothetical protein [Deinococcus sp.]
MTVFDVPGQEDNGYVFVQAVAFPQVLALPQWQSMPGGDVFTFRFSNGYGAVVTRAVGVTLESAFEFGVLDCTLAEPRLIVHPAMSASVVQGASYEQVAALLPLAEGLALHPAWQQSLVSLEDEEF